MKVWVLNLDAELELARAGPYQSTQPVLRALEPWAEQARRCLLAPGDQLLSHWAQDPEREPDVLGECWSPTPSALVRLTKAGVRLPPTPAVDVLRRVCQRRFYLGLGGGAPGARYFEDLDSALAALEARDAVWLFKRPFGFAGRGQRRLSRQLSPDDQRWLADSLRQGGLLGEPWLDIERELSQHGKLSRDGHLQLGRPCAQRTDAQRAWLASEPLAADDLGESARRALAGAAERAAEALFRAGYFGPFGIDAYLWRTPAGGLELNPLGELNARYTMGWSVGMSTTNG